MRKLKKYFGFFLGLIVLFSSCKKENNTANLANNVYNYVNDSQGLLISSTSNSSPIYLSKSDFTGVKKIAKIFQEDVERVTGTKPELIITNKVPHHKKAIIVGTIGKSVLIDQLIKEKKINVSSIKGKRETFIIETVKKPFKDVEEALVIVGSDKRGTIYGMFDVSYEIGVSPLYFWADVPVKKKENIYIKRGSYSKGTPKVKYRGIFINDEAPGLTGWAYPKFGGFNSKFYSHVFELILRMKGNYLWPAMWSPRAFYADDPINGELANELGIVMGTSHHEPLARAHAEWKAPYAKGDWNFEKNPEELTNFWTTGMERAKDWESIITVGMRGDGDEAMSEETSTALLEKVVNEQRKIIEKVTGKPAEETPQMWALYKEVQDYYDKGMQVPDDVTLLLCDDNWGNLRKLPELDAKPREGGYGIYYHFDYVGGPRNYKWINTTQIERVWEQMNLAYEHNVDKIWIVNVGDIKPTEFPLEFFMDFAWNPNKWNANNLQDYYVQWATKQFGKEYALEIADLIRKYTKYNAHRKPELLNIPKYSLTNFNEADNLLVKFKDLEKQTLALKAKLPKEYLDAYYHLVEHPVVGATTLNELYIAAEKNKFYAKKNSIKANEYAKKVEELFSKDSLITEYYHKELANGKWNGIMAQTHIGYTYWNSPKQNNMPETFLVDVEKATIEVKEITNKDKAVDIPKDAKGFVENNNYISFEADKFSNKTEPSPFLWKVVKNLGKTGASVISLPIKKGRVALTKNSPKLSYNVHFKNKGNIKVHAYFSPTINYSTRKGMYFGLSLNDEKPVKVNYDSDPLIFNYNGKVPSKWHDNVSDNIKIITTEFSISKTGNHTLNYYRVDEGLVLQKIVIETGTSGIPKSYFGPPQSPKAN